MPFAVNVTNAFSYPEALEPTAVRSASPPLKVTPLFDIAELVTSTLPVAAVASTLVNPESDVRVRSLSPVTTSFSLPFVEIPFTVAMLPAAALPPVELTVIVSIPFAVIAPVAVVIFVPSVALVLSALPKLTVIVFVVAVVFAPVTVILLPAVLSANTSSSTPEAAFEKVTLPASAAVWSVEKPEAS